MAGTYGAEAIRQMLLSQLTYEGIIDSALLVKLFLDTNSR